MHRVRTTGACFALRGGYPVGETPFAYLPAEDVRGRSRYNGVMLALVEPLCPAPGAGDAANDVIRQMLDDCGGPSGDVTTQVVLDAFQSANARLFRENSKRALVHRIHLGLIVVVARGDEVIVAHTPPGQLFVRQNSAIYSVPPVEHGRRNGRLSTARQHDVAQPLGLRSEVAPNIFVTLAESDDLFVALTSDLARCIAQYEQRLSSVTNIVDTLELVIDVSERQFVSTGHGVIAFVPSGQISENGMHRRVQAPDSARQRGERRAAAIDGGLSNTGRAVSDWQFRTDPLDLLAPAGQTRRAHEDLYEKDSNDWSNRHEDHDRSVSAIHGSRRPGTVHSSAVEPKLSGRPCNLAAPQAHAVLPGDSRNHSSFVFTADNNAFDRRDHIAKHSDQHGFLAETGPFTTIPAAPRPRGPAVVELLAGLILSLTAAVVGAWQVTKRDRPLHGPLDDGSFGLPRLQRWDESYRPPRMQRVRSRLPRLEVSRVVVLVAVLLVTGLSVMYYFSHASSQTQQGVAEALTVLQQAEAQRVAATGMSDPWAAYEALLAADTSLASLAAGDVTDAEQLTAVRAAIAADIARITHSQRLSNVQVVGGVPAAPSGRGSKLAVGGGGLYLLADGVYQVDLFSGSLVRLLMPGDTVGDSEVGTLLGVTWREDRLLATDASRSYAFDITRGAWAPEELATLDGVDHTGVAAIATFDRNLYMLSPETGQILKFQAGAYDGPMEDWTGGIAADELMLGIDMAIDGHVLVLLEDGRVLDFLRSRLEATITPQAIPALEHVSAIAAPAGSAYIYLLHETDGRILRMTRDGAIVQQFTSPVAGASPILSGAVDLAVDEVNGVAHILARNTIYTIRLPAPPAE